MMKTQFGLGILSMPVVFDTMGIIPGIILVLAIAGITTWSNYMVGAFKARHPEVYSIADVGQMFFGRIGAELFGGGYALCKLKNSANSTEFPCLSCFRLYIHCRLRDAQHVYCS